MPSSPVLHVRAVTREGRPIKDAQILVWRIIPAGALKPLLGNWSTSETGELRTQLPLPSELLTVARESQTPLRFLVLAWHPQAGWAWSVARQGAIAHTTPRIFPMRTHCLPDSYRCTGVVYPISSARTHRSGHPHAVSLLQRC